MANPALDSYADGVRVVQRLGSKFVDWDLPTPCQGWRALDVAGHVLCIARYYHRLLDAARAGTPKAGLPRGQELATFNAAELAALEIAEGPDRIVAFDAVATRYGERLSEVDADLVLGTWTGPQVLTVGEHLKVAASEWHLHAWDLASALGWDYRPADPTVLFERWGARSWDGVLEASGRRAEPSSRPAGP